MFRSELRSPSITACLAAVGLWAGPGPEGYHAVRQATTALGPEIYRFQLSPTTRAAGATGEGRLTLGWSPFGVAVSADGHLVYDLDIGTQGLIDPSRRAPGSGYVAWIASPDLTRIERLGALSDGKLTTRISTWNKFLVLVTLEADPDVARRAGPVMLRGRSPSGFIASFQSHELFNLIPH